MGNVLGRRIEKLEQRLGRRKGSIERVSEEESLKIIQRLIDEVKSKPPRPLDTEEQKKAYIEVLKASVAEQKAKENKSALDEAIIRSQENRIARMEGRYCGRGGHLYAGGF
jgi:hypothetical protein